MSKRLWSTLPVLAASMAFGLSTTSCGGGGGSTTSPDLVLLGFNQPNVSGVALNQPLVLTFSADIDPLSITPDTLRIVGDTGPFFEMTHVDGNLIALLPRTPNFDDYTDVGLFPNTQYNVSLTTFPAVDTIESTSGKPLLSAPTFSFRTVPFPAFIEPRRPLEHGTPPSLGGFSDDEGCLQNPGNGLYIDPYPANTSADPLPQQTNSLPGGRLLCLQNEGPPHVLPGAACTPRHDQKAVGTPAAGSQNIGRVSLPAIQIAMNEVLDPLTVTPYPSTQLPTNVQLWRVGHLDGTAVTPPEPIQVNKPLIVQSLAGVEIILVPSDAVLQGIYMVNVTANVKDLPGNRLVITDRPNLTGTVYAALDAGLGPNVPQGYRYFFQTLQIAGAASAINESFGTNIGEWGDINSLATEPGVMTQTQVATNPLFPIPGSIPVGMATESCTLLFGPNPGTALQCGQSTTANWNNGFRFLNIPSLEANVDADNGSGRLKATWRPYCGGAGDGTLDTSVFPFTAGPGDVVGITTTPGTGGSVNSDGIYEYASFKLEAGDTFSIAGTKPCLIMVRGDFEVDGTIILSGQPGRFGLDTDTSPASDYTNVGAILTWGVGGVGGPGGGAGGRGSGPLVGVNATASPGAIPNDLFGVHTGVTGGGFGPFGQPAGSGSGGGGGGGFGSAGSAGAREDLSSAVNGGVAFGTPLFERALNLFQPDRGYSPNADVTGGTGGGGGGTLDENSDNTSNIGDDAGAGGGGAGGGLWVIAGGSVRVGPTGSIIANGGAGGSTYNRANQRINLGPPIPPSVTPAAGDGNDFVDGLKNGAVPSGAGGPGGGGSGGAIFLVGQGGVNIQAGAVLSAIGGVGGAAGTAGHVGGTGGDGRICLMDVGGTGIVNSGTSTPAATPFTWNPTVKETSVGQSQWIDLFTPTVQWNPVVNFVQQVPFSTDNFQALIDLGKVRGTGPADDFDALWEFQGAASLTPVPSAGTPTLAGGLTQWSSNIDLADGLRYFRYRWRFRVNTAYTGFGLTATALPSVLDVTIPFTK
jgi:hypothetical protein